MAGLIERSREVKVGDPLDEDTKVGAIISAEHLAKIKGHLTAAVQAGAKLRLGGERLVSSGLFMAPTVVDEVGPDMRIASDEVFGPVVTVLSFETADEAVALANQPAYGLSASVWSRDIDTVTCIGRKLRAGTVWANTFMDGTPELPFGGYSNPGLGANSAAMPLPTTPRKRPSTFTAVRARVGGLGRTTGQA